jgi:archaellum component FlaC
MLSNIKDIKKLKDAITEISNSMTRNDAERDFQKEAVARIAEELDLDKKNVKKIAAIYHKQNFTEVQQEQEDIVELYESISTA